MSDAHHVADEGSRGRVVTFYSYKGGVGRSMLLANVATLLARWGQRVLVIDFDLEAPGLDSFFQPYSSRPLRSTAGVVDMLLAVSGGKKSDWREFVSTVELPEGRQIDLMHAGQLTGSYATNLANLDWAQMFEQYDFGRFLEEWRTEMVSADAYDFVMIDSRTGFTDIGGICTIHLPDVLVGLVTTTNQSLTGLRAAMDGAVAGHASFPIERELLLTLPIASRDESAHAYDRAVEWRARFANELGHLFRWAPTSTDPRTIFDWLRIPYETHWSFGEQLPVLVEDVENPKNISFSYFQIAQLLKSRFNWNVVRERNPSESEAIAKKEQEWHRERELFMVQQKEAFNQTLERLAISEEHARKEIKTRARVLALSVVSLFCILAVVAFFGIAKFNASKDDLLIQAEEERRRILAQAETDKSRIMELEAEKKRTAALEAYGRGHNLIASREYPSAILAFDEAIKYNANLFDAYRSRAVAKSRIAESRPAKSSSRKEAMYDVLVDFDSWADLAPTSRRRLDIAKLAAKEGLPEHAVKQASKFVSTLALQPDAAAATEMLEVLRKLRIGEGEIALELERQTVIRSLSAYTPKRQDLSGARKSSTIASTATELGTFSRFSPNNVDFPSDRSRNQSQQIVLPQGLLRASPSFPPQSSTQRSSSTPPTK